jgi:hypothetical protein
MLALGLMCKPILVTTPCLLLLDFWPLDRLDMDGAPMQADARGGPRRKVLPLVFEKGPMFVLVAASSVVTYLAQSRTEAAHFSILSGTVSARSSWAM